MKNLSSLLAKGALISALGIGALGATVSTASAEVACNRFGECWHVQNHYNYPTGLGIVIRGDDWGVRHHDHHWRWRDNHDGRGYYRNGVWFAF